VKYLLDSLTMNVSFAGCGFLGLYHVGVVSCLKKYAPQLNNCKLSGCSAGAMAAVCGLLEMELGPLTSEILALSTEARKLTLGPFSPSFNVVKLCEDGLHKNLPDNIHEVANGRLHISVTKVYDGSNLLVTEFSSKQEVIDVVIASTFIPIFSGWLPPRYRGIRVIDGGYSDNLPVLDDQTVTVSPFSGGSDICPQDDLVFNVLQVNIANTSMELSKENLFRLGRVLIPPDPEVLSSYCKQGFDDALRFLQSRYLISCTRCLAVTSSYEVEEENVDACHGSSGCTVYDPNCLECKLHRHIANQSTVPDNVWEVFENAINEAENGLTSWIEILGSYRIVRLISYPAAIPISVTKNFIDRLSKILHTQLEEKSKLRNSVERLIDQLYSVAEKANLGFILPSNPRHSARYTCEFNLTQYGEDSMTDLTKYSEKERRESVKDLFNLGFTAHLETEEAPYLPLNQEDAIRFQSENLAAAVLSQSHSRVVSLGPSRRGSTVASRAVSRVPSRLGSRSNSMESIYDVDGELPDTIEQIKKVTESQDAVMAFYFTDSDNQVKVMEIFDVTETDPSLLVDDTIPQTPLPGGRNRHSSGPPSSAIFSPLNKRRHSSAIPEMGLNSTPLSPLVKFDNKELQSSVFVNGGDDTNEKSSLDLDNDLKDKMLDISQEVD